MYNHKIVDKYEDYLELFQKRQDELNDYDMQPMNYDEFEEGYLDWNKRD